MMFDEIQSMSDEALRHWLMSAQQEEVREELVAVLVRMLSGDPTREEEDQR